MDKPIIIGAAGYPSIDRILRLGAPAEVGKTSVIANDDYNTPSYGGCCVNICYVLARLGVEAMPFMNVGEDFSSSGYRAFLQAPRLSLAATKVVPGVNTSSSLLLEDPAGDHVTLFYEGAMRGELAVFDRQDAVERISLGVVTVGSLAYNTGFLRALLDQGKEAAFSMKFDPHAFPEPQLREFLQSSAYIYERERGGQHLPAAGLAGRGAAVPNGAAEVRGGDEGQTGVRSFFKGRRAHPFTGRGRGQGAPHGRPRRCGRRLCGGLPLRGDAGDGLYPLRAAGLGDGVLRAGAERLPERRAHAGTSTGKRERELLKCQHYI